MEKIEYKNVETMAGKHDITIEYNEELNPEFKETINYLDFYITQILDNKENEHEIVNTIRTICRNLKDAKVAILRHKRTSASCMTTDSRFYNNELVSFKGVYTYNKNMVTLKKDKSTNNAADITYTTKDLDLNGAEKYALDIAKNALLANLGNIIRLDIEKDMKKNTFLAFLTKVYRMAYKKDPNFADVCITEEFKDLFDKLDEQGFRLYGNKVNNKDAKITYLPNHNNKGKLIRNAKEYDYSDLGDLYKYGLVTEDIDKDIELDYIQINNKPELNEIIEEAGKQILKDYEDWKNEK